MRANTLDESGTDKHDDNANEQPYKRNIGQNVIGWSGDRIQVAVKRIAQDQDSQHRNDPLPCPQAACKEKANGAYIGQDIGHQDQEHANRSQVSEEGSTVNPWKTAPDQHNDQGNCWRASTKESSRRNVVFFCSIDSFLRLSTSHYNLQGKNTRSLIAYPIHAQKTI